MLHWWSSEPERVSPKASRLIDDADELAVAAISWWELAWMADHGRVRVHVPVRSWLERLATVVRTAHITPAIATVAVSLPTTFPGDPADRLIFSTAVEHGWPLVSKDRRLRSHRHPRQIVIW